MTAKPFRRRGKGGRLIGSFYGKPRKGDAVCLQTTDPELALQRLRLLRAGKWHPVKGKRISDQPDDDSTEAAAAVDAAMSGDASPPAPSPAPPPAPPPPAAAPPAPPAEPPIVPELLPPVRPENWNADAAAAAQEETEAGGDQGEADVPPGPQVDPDTILQAAAEGWLWGCKALGAWMARRQGKKPNQIPPSDAVAYLERITVDSTKATIAALLPQVGEIGPEWGMIGGGLAIAAMQFVGAEPADAGGEDGQG